MTARTARRTSARVARGIALVGVLLVGGSLVLGACSSRSGAKSADASASSSESPSSSAPSESESVGESGAQLVAPVMTSLDELDGAEVTTSVGRAVVVRVDGDGSGWTGTTDDSAVATFVEGGTRGNAAFNPGFDPVASGTTRATLSGPDGQSVSFTLVVE